MNKLKSGTISLATLLALSANSWAAEDSFEEEPRWFEVEIIVYKSTSQQGLFEESWDTDVELTKPENLVDFLQPFEPAPSSNPLSQDELLTGGQLDDAFQSHNETVDQNTITTSNNALAADEAQTNGQLTDSAQTDSAQTDADPAASDEALTSSFIEEEKPFVLLDESLLQLTNEAKSLNRHPEYQVLVHHAWRQPVLGAGEAPHIRIAGGQDFSESFEYDGTRKLAKIDPLSLDGNEPFGIGLSANELPASERPVSERPVSEQSGIDLQVTEQATDEVPIDMNQQLNAANSASSDSPANQQAASQSLGENSVVQNGDEQFATENALTSQGENVIEMIPSPWVPELDGDIKVYLGRYLHVRTNLYLRRPDKEEVEIIDIEMLNSDRLTTFGTEQSDFLTTDREFNFESEDNAFAATQNDPISAEPNTNLFETNSIGTNTDSFLANTESQFSWEIDDNFLETESEKMYIERLFNYPVQQSRRMRSGELHFFDHPLVGVLVMIRPYERNQEITEEDGLLPPSL